MLVLTDGAMMGRADSKDAGILPDSIRVIAKRARDTSQDIGFVCSMDVWVGEYVFCYR